MICKYCRVAMVGGTRYQQNKDRNGKNSLFRQRFNKCRSCDDIVLNDSLNFQEHLRREEQKQYRK